MSELLQQPRLPEQVKDLLASKLLEGFSIGLLNAYREALQFRMPPKCDEATFNAPLDEGGYGGGLSLFDCETGENPVVYSYEDYLKYTNLKVQSVSRAINAETYLAILTRKLSHASSDDYKKADFIIAHKFDTVTGVAIQNSGAAIGFWINGQAYTTNEALSEGETSWNPWSKFTREHLNFALDLLAAQDELGWAPTYDPNKDF